MKQVRLLFICTHNACRSQMAEGLALARSEPGVQVVSAGSEATKVDPRAIQVMQEAGIDISGQESKALDGLNSTRFDVVIALCDEAAATCPVLPGIPQVVRWNLPDPAATGGSPEQILDAFRASRDNIQRLVDDFFDRGYLRALTAAKVRTDMVLDNITDGVIAHDLDRRIFYFNRAAEAITGYSRNEVVDQYCQDVFPGNFCGGKCHFCEDTPALQGECEQELRILTKSGESRTVRMVLKRMTDQQDRDIGVLVTFRDVTREERLSRQLGDRNQFSGIISRDTRMLEVFDLIRDLADADVPVLVQGESGTGKELVAAAIHNEGLRAARLFVPVNCGALPESLLESELFGHVKGAFTGAIRDKKGRFELADGGTIFLDEIGDISPAMQVRLLRVLQEGRFERVGSEQTIQVDVRVISATHKDLAAEIAAGRFREDLFYRLSVVPLDLPPLRERRNDIPLLLDHILARIQRQTGAEKVTVSPEAMDVMLSHHWPGNVRELENWVQFSLIKRKQGPIRPDHLPPQRSPDAAASSVQVQPRRRKKLSAGAVREAMARTGGNKLEAAKVLGVSRATLYRFISDSGME